MSGQNLPRERQKKIQKLKTLVTMKIDKRLKQKIWIAAPQKDSGMKCGFAEAQRRSN
ncbi:MAG: hypothetical protein FWF87_00190 [Synergistaceae bacterium]|nr:hypothetical protein [Synergistaceae bacterium]